MIKKFLSVSDFRDEIDFAFDAINCHWHSCVSKSERVQWFVNSISRFDKLSQMDCKRAKLSDRARYDSVIDRFSSHCQNNFDLWLEARFKSGLITKDQYTAVVLIESSTNLLQSVH